MKNILLLISLLVSTVLAAQVPGYQGRRFLISANIGPNFILPNGYSGDYNDVVDGSSFNSFKIRPRFGASIDWTLNRKSTIGIKYSLVQMGANAPVYSLEPGWMGYPDEVLYTGDGSAKIKCHSVGLRYTKYGRRNDNLPAPLGTFGGYQLGVGLSQFYDVDGRFLTRNGIVNKGLYLTTIHPDVIVFFGVRRGIGKRMMWSFLTEFNFAYLGFIVADVNWDIRNMPELEPGTNEAGKHQYIANKYLARSNYFNSNIINLTFELTFLPF